jgi:beta-galactosidase
VTELGAIMARLPEMRPESRARVALVLDWENGWAISNDNHPAVFDYWRLVERWYMALHAQHVSIDIVHPTADLSGYGLVVAPQLYLLADEGAANLKDFVQSGGHLLVSAFSDVVDADDAFRPGGYLVGLRVILGITLEDFGALVPPGPDAGPGEDHATVQAPFGQIRGELFAEEIHLAGAEKLGTFVEGRLTGRVAMTRHRTGEGTATYLATVPDDAGMRSLLGWALEEAGVEPELHGLPPQVEVARRGDCLTIINHGAEPATVRAPHLTDVLTGGVLDDEVLEPFAFRIARETA